MINNLNPILNIGIDRCDKLQIDHLRMVNLLASLCVSGTLIFCALFWFAFKNEPSAFINLAFIGLFLFTFFLTKNGYLWIARYWIFLIFFSQHFYIPLFVLSDNFETELLLLVVPTTVILVFDPNERFPRYALSVIAIFLLFLAKTFPASDPILTLTQDNAKAAYLCIILILVMLSFVLMDFYLLDLQSINKASRQYIYKDILTNTKNAQSIFNEVNKLFLKAKKTNEPLSVIAINIDDFRRINLIHGRETGDRVLISFSDLIIENLPEKHPVGRLFGDTFVVLLENTNTEKTLEITHQLKNLIKRNVFLIGHSAVKCKAHFGISTLKKDDFEGYCLIDNAVIAMNEATTLKEDKIKIYIPKNRNTPSLPNTLEVARLR